MTVIFWWLESSDGLSRRPFSAQALLWWGNRWQKTDSGFAVFWRRYFCQTELLFILADFLRLVAVSRAVMSMAVHGANQMRERVWLPSIWTWQGCPSHVASQKLGESWIHFLNSPLACKSWTNLCLHFVWQSALAFNAQDNFCAKFFLNTSLGLQVWHSFVRSRRVCARLEAFFCLSSVCVVRAMLSRVVFATRVDRRVRVWSWCLELGVCSYCSVLGGYFSHPIRALQLLLLFC